MVEAESVFHRMGKNVTTKIRCGVEAGKKSFSVSSNLRASVLSESNFLCDFVAHGGTPSPHLPPFVPSVSFVPEFTEKDKIFTE